MRIILIATTDLAAGRDADLMRMLESLDQQRMDGLPSIRLFLLVQNAAARSKTTLDVWSAFTDVVAVPFRLPLSRARNLLLRPLLASGQLTSDTIVLFPDDDCWFEPGHLARIVSLFEADARLGSWFCDFGCEPEREPHRPMAGRAARVRDVVRTAASITLAIRGDVACSVGLFDERLGLGAPNIGGEDTDYAMRAFLASPTMRMTTEKLMGHRDRSQGPSALYFDGCLMALAKHAHRHVGLAWEFARKVAVGSVLVWRGELSAAAFAGALRKAALSRAPASTSAAACQDGT